MKKFLNGLFNVCWVLFVGIWSAISSAITGVVNCLTIIGIPFGLQHFKFIKLVFAPVGKVVVTRYGKHPVMNTFWLLFGGIITGVIYWFLSIVLCITIIGIPLGKQLMKISKFNFAPFGCEVVKEGEYTSWGESKYDLKLLKRRLLSNPEANVVDENGVSMTARQYIEQHKDQLVKGQKTIKKLRRIGIWICVGIVGAIILGESLVCVSTLRSVNINQIFLLTLTYIISAPIVIAPNVIAPIVIFNLIERHIEKNTIKKVLLPLREYYSMGSIEKRKWNKRITLNTIIEEFYLYYVKYDSKRV